MLMSSIVNSIKEYHVVNSPTGMKFDQIEAEYWVERILGHVYHMKFEQIEAEYWVGRILGHVYDMKFDQI